MRGLGYAKATLPASKVRAAHAASRFLMGSLALSYKEPESALSSHLGSIVFCGECSERATWLFPLAKNAPKEKKNPGYSPGNNTGNADRDFRNRTLPLFTNTFGSSHLYFTQNMFMEDGKML